MVALPLRWMMDAGGINDTRNEGDSIIKNPIGAFIGGNLSGIIDASAITRISTAGGYSREPSAGQGAWKPDPRILHGYKEKKAKARKWAKRLKVIKLLLHKIKEKLKE